MDVVLPGQLQFGVKFGAAGKHIADGFGAPASQMPGGDQSVGAVVARPDQHGDGYARHGAAEFIPGGLGDG